MLWLNIPTEFLGSAEFLGCEPVERATWLSLMGHCAIAENGGRIVGALDWKDRKWQQVVGVTLEEVNSDCDLWEWDGEDLILPHYPEEKEAEVQAKREAGRQGGLKRWKNQRAKQPDSSATSTPIDAPNSSAIEEPYTERNGTGTQTELERNGTESPNPASGGPSAFEQFWNAYPKKIGKGAAEKAFAKAKKKPPIAEIIEAVRRQGESKQWIDSDGQFIPNPATWINQERWGDEIKTDEQKRTEKYENGTW